MMTSLSPAKKISLILGSPSANNASQCLLDNKEIVNLTPLGDASLYGDISLIELGNNREKAVLKKIPLTNGNPDDLTTSIGVELKILELVTELSNLGISNNFSTLSEKSLCKKCTYSNPNLGKKATACLTTIAPFSDSGTLKSFLLNLRKRRKFNDYDISIAYFQIFAGLYAMQRYFNASHHDLHWSNVFLTKNENYKEGAFEIYYINGETYFLPSYPYTFQIADFGFARIPGKLEIQRESEYYKEPAQKQRLSADYSRISSMLWQLSLDEELDIPRSSFVKRILDLSFQGYKQGMPISILMSQLFSQFQGTIPYGAKIVNVWDLDKDISAIFDPKLSSYVVSESRKTRGQLEKENNKILSQEDFKQACQILLTDPRIYEKK